MQWKINDMVICLQIGKTYTTKTLSGDFKVTTPEILLLSQQVVTSKGISIPYTNLQLNPYPNTQLDLFCSDNFSFQCTALKYMTNQCADPNTRLQSPTREGCKVLQFIHTMKIKKMLGHKTLQCTYTTSSKEMNQGKTLSPVMICLNKLLSKLVQLVYSLTALKIIILYV